MPLKTSAPDRRSVEIEIEVPGTPEQVWKALATGPGFSAWFMPTTIKEHVGGDVTFVFGPGMQSKGSVTTSEPPYPSGVGRTAYDFWLACHDELDLFLIALLVGKELPNTSLPGADVGEEFF